MHRQFKNKKGIAEVFVFFEISTAYTCMSLSFRFMYILRKLQEHKYREKE